MTVGIGARVQEDVVDVGLGVCLARGPLPVRRIICPFTPGERVVGSRVVEVSEVERPGGVERDAGCIQHRAARAGIGRKQPVTDTHGGRVGEQVAINCEAA